MCYVQLLCGLVFHLGETDPKDAASNDIGLGSGLSIDGKGLQVGNSSAVDGGEKEEAEESMTNEDLKPNGNSDLCTKSRQRQNICLYMCVCARNPCSLCASGARRAKTQL